MVHTGENSETRCEGRMQEGEVGIGDPRSTNGVETILVYTEWYAPNAYNLWIRNSSSVSSSMSSLYIAEDVYIYRYSSSLGVEKLVNITELLTSI